MIHPHYPTAEEVNAWCEDLLARGQCIPVMAYAVDAPQYAYQLGVRHTSGNYYVAFESEGRTTFYGYWQPAPSKPAPVLFHLPSYDGEISAHPELVLDGYHVLHINPLGYCTPEGATRADHQWPVLPDTVKSHGKSGYAEWLLDAIIAVQWALRRSDVEHRFGFFGTSQGGGAALLLGSIFAGRGVEAVAADVPYLTNFPLMSRRKDRGAYGLVDALKPEADHAGEWKALGFVDTLSHAHRLDMPTLLVAGSCDAATPPDSITSLFDVLPGTRSYTCIFGQDHACTVPFIHLARTWFALHV